CLRSSSSRSPSIVPILSASLASGARCWVTSYRRHPMASLRGTITSAHSHLSVGAHPSPASIPQVWARASTSNAFPKARSSRIGSTLMYESVPGSWGKSAWPPLRPNARASSRSARLAYDCWPPMRRTSRASLCRTSKETSSASTERTHGAQRPGRSVRGDERSLAGRVVGVDLTDIAARLGVPVEEIERVHELGGDKPSAPLPAKANAPAILDRLAVRPDDAAEVMAGWPDSGSPLWTPELRWLLDRSIALIRADLGRSGWLPPGPALPRDRGPAWRHLYVYAYLALLDVVMSYHRDHGIPDTVSWVTLADLGRNLAI